VVLRHPELVQRALTIFELSEFLTDILVRHPGEVSLLERAVEHAQPTGEALFRGEPPSIACVQDPVFAYLARGNIDRDEALSILRQHYRRSVFLLGAQDIFRPRDIFESLAEYTAAADAAIQASLAIAAPAVRFSVMGLGRLGAREFDVLSDGDVLFVCDEHHHGEETARVAGRFMEALTAYTRDGTVFPVDTRLRPHGREGELVVTPSQLAAYFRDEAKPWEALTYLKLRYVAGDVEVADRALKAVQAGIWEMAKRPEFDAELAEVRERLEKNEGSQNFKTGPGGVYDIDYLAGSLQAKHQVWPAGNLRHRLLALCDRGLLEGEECRFLVEGADFLRTLEHVLRLVDGRSRKWLPVASHSRRAVQKLLWKMLGGDDSFDPEMRLAEVMRGIRGIYRTQRQGNEGG
jgi:glutamate-ammonia-ligase adenylyltransferase